MYFSYCHDDGQLTHINLGKMLAFGINIYQWTLIVKRKRKITDNFIFNGEQDSYLNLFHLPLRISYNQVHLYDVYYFKKQPP